jgi:hypothetical protein
MNGDDWVLQASEAKCLEVCRSDLYDEEIPCLK